MAESFSREKLRQASQKEGGCGWKIPVLPSSCVTPVGTSIEVQNEWEENTHTHNKYTYTHTVADYLILLPVLKLSPCAQQPMMGDIFQVVCSSTWGIFFFVSRSRPMGLNALGYQSHVQQRRHLAYGHEAKIK